MDRADRATTRSARRTTVRRWRDPRLLLGVLLVVGAGAIGARVVANADTTVEYWAVADDVRAGDPVTTDDLTVTRARLTGAAADRYVRADEELPAALDDLTWTSDLAAGTLVGRAAWAAVGASAGHLPVTVQTGFLPTDLAPGERVDVWVGPGPGEDTGEPARLVVSGLRVLDAGGSETLGASVTRTVVLDLGEIQVDGRQIADLAARHVTLVRVP